MNNKRKYEELVIFTINYPYGNGEEFIEQELAIASKYYERIFVVPSKKHDKIRAVPYNAEIIDDLAGLVLKDQYILQFIYIFLYDLFLENNALQKLRAVKVYYRFVREQIEKKKIIKALLIRFKDKLKNPVLYDFWLINNGLAISLLKDLYDINLYSNVHSYDLYDFRWGCPLPFRSYIIRKLEKVFPDSAYGEKYLKEKISKKLHSKVELSYMGIIDNGIGPRPTGDEIIVVSCSSCSVHKRVEMIVDALSELKLKKVKWIHFGDGEKYDEIRLMATKKLKNIAYELRGWVKSEELIAFYKENFVNVFVHASSAEGAPVSLMIAASFGIPIVAFDSMGVAEITNNELGVLLDKESGAKDLSNALEEAILTKSEDLVLRKNIRDHWKKRFSINNYHRLHGELINPKVNQQHNN
jgi:glycosyltransferase involved in cell wall biosynthesis